MDKSIEITNLINQIFSNPPREPKAYSINFQLENVKELFETLIYILAEGIKILHKGNPIDITQLNSENIDLLRSYFNSFGIQLTIGINHIEQSSVDTSKEKLSDYYFSIHSNTDKNYYIITFDYI